VTILRVRGEASSIESALALCAVNNECSVHSTIKCLDVERSHRGSWTLSFAGDLLLSRTQRISLVYERNARHIAGDGDDSVMVHFNTGRNWFSAEQHGREYELDGNRGGLWVHNLPIGVAGGDGSHFYGIGLPRELTRNWKIAPEDLAGRAFDVNHPACRLLRAHMDILDQTDPDPVVMAAIRVHVGELTGLWLGGLKDSHWRDGNTAERQQGHAAAITAVVARRHAEAHLSAAAVGREVGLAERTVQHVLSREGTSFSRLLGATRAEAAHARLSDRRYSGLSVTDIALACGFNDMSAFYRAFRARYDCNPSDVRAR